MVDLVKKNQIKYGVIILTYSLLVFGVAKGAGAASIPLKNEEEQVEEAEEISFWKKYENYFWSRIYKIKNYPYLNKTKEFGNSIISYPYKNRTKEFGSSVISYPYKNRTIEAGNYVWTKVSSIFKSNNSTDKVKTDL